MCVLLNKRDMPGALSQSQLDTVMRLHDLRLSHPGRLQVRSNQCATAACHATVYRLVGAQLAWQKDSVLFVGGCWMLKAASCSG
jgi:hypothetical protein